MGASVSTSSRMVTWASATTVRAAGQSQGEEKDLSEGQTKGGRKKRPGEINGEHYYFLSKEKFKKMIKDNLFIEWAEFADNFYGTPVESITQKIDSGYKVILEIEVEGARQIKEKFPNSVSIFLLPPNIKELEKRIRDRGTENEESISRRLERSKFEISCSKDFDYIVINKNLKETINKVYEIIES